MVRISLFRNSFSALVLFFSVILGTTFPISSFFERSECQISHQRALNASLELSHWEIKEDLNLNQPLETKTSSFEIPPYLTSQASQSGLPSDQIFESYWEDKIVLLVRLGIVDGRIFHFSHIPFFRIFQDRTLGDSSVSFLLLWGTVRERTLERLFLNNYKTPNIFGSLISELSQGFAFENSERAEKRKITRYFARLTHSDPENKRNQNIL